MRNSRLKYPIKLIVGSNSLRPFVSVVISVIPGELTCLLSCRFSWPFFPVLQGKRHTHLGPGVPLSPLRGLSYSPLGSSQCLTSLSYRDSIAGKADYRATRVLLAGGRYVKNYDSLFKHPSMRLQRLHTFPRPFLLRVSSQQSAKPPGRHGRNLRHNRLGSGRRSHLTV